MSAEEPYRFPVAVDAIVEHRAAMEAFKMHTSVELHKYKRKWVPATLCIITPQNDYIVENEADNCSRAAVVYVPGYETDISRASINKSRVCSCWGDDHAWWARRISYALALLDGIEAGRYVIGHPTEEERSAFQEARSKSESKEVQS